MDMNKLSELVLPDLTAAFGTEDHQSVLDRLHSLTGFSGTVLTGLNHNFQTEHFMRV